MAAFSKNKNNFSRIDWRILINGSISLYHKDEILQKDLKWLEDNKYESKIIDFDQIYDIDEFHKLIKEICNFPEYYGENISALNDCLYHDLEIPYRGGIVFVLKKFDKFYVRDKSSANDILEVLYDMSRKRMLMGERLITIIQSDNPLFSPDKIGIRNIMWNINEFYESKRIEI